MNAGVQEGEHGVQRATSFTGLVEVNGHVTRQHRRFIAGKAGIQCCAIGCEPDAVFKDGVHAFDVIDTGAHNLAPRIERLVRHASRGSEVARSFPVLLCQLQFLEILLQAIGNVLRTITLNPPDAATVFLELLVKPAIRSGGFAVLTIEFDVRDCLTELRIEGAGDKALRQLLPVHFRTEVQVGRLQISRKVRHEEHWVGRGQAAREGAGKPGNEPDVAVVQDWVQFFCASVFHSARQDGVVDANEERLSAALGHKPAGIARINRNAVATGIARWVGLAEDTPVWRWVARGEVQEEIANAVALATDDAGLRVCEGDRQRGERRCGAATGLLPLIAADGEPRPAIVHEGVVFHRRDR